MCHLLCSCLLFCLLSVHLSAAEPVSDGDHVLIYDDGLFEDIVDAAEKELSEDLKKRKIDWTTKRNKGASLNEIADSLEKDVLKKKPTHVVLSFGIYDVCDPKKLSIKEYDAAALMAELDKAVRILKEAGKHVIICTPGLAGENLDEEHQTAIDELSEAVRAYAAEKSIKLCDVRKKAVAWIKANPPKKKGRLQLSKRGGKWDDEGEALLAPVLMGSLGLSKSGIKRAIKWDERVILASSMSEWQVKIEKVLEKEIREAGPKEAPKGYFNPGVKGPVFINAAIGDFEKTDFEADRVQTQKPTVMFLYPFHRLLMNTQYPAERAAPRLDQAMKFMSEADYPCFALTPFWCNETGQKVLGEKGKRYERCKALAEMTREAAAKYGVPVIDLFALCEKEHAANNAVVYWGVYESDPKQLIMYDDGRRLLGQEIKRVLGILKEEN